MSAIRIKPQTSWTDGKGIITVKSTGGELKTIEREVEKLSRVGTDLTPEPLYSTPNRYANRKKCVCAEHEGDKWVHRSQFGYDKRTSDGLRSWCRVCEARQKRFAYVPRWKRGV